MMKQHINPEQLNELSEKAKERLRVWWKPKVGDWFITKLSSLYLAYHDWPGHENDEGNPIIENLLTEQEVDGGYYGWSLGESFPDGSEGGEDKKAAEAIRNDALPLLSIGQMIEFLDEEYGAWTMDSWQQWQVVNRENNQNNLLAERVELCDSLWEVVKEALEGKENG